MNRPSSRKILPRKQNGNRRNNKGLTGKLVGLLAAIVTAFILIHFLVKIDFLAIGLIEENKLLLAFISGLVLDHVFHSIDELLNWLVK
jgi:hypothetical protein